jgi:hypothetical protein
MAMTIDYAPKSPLKSPLDPDRRGKPLQMGSPAQ